MKAKEWFNKVADALEAGKWEWIQGRTAEWDEQAYEDDGHLRKALWNGNPRNLPCDVMGAAASLGQDYEAMPEGAVRVFRRLFGCTVTEWNDHQSMTRERMVSALRLAGANVRQ